MASKDYREKLVVLQRKKIELQARVDALKRELEPLQTKRASAVEALTKEE